MYRGRVNPDDSAGCAVFGPRWLAGLMPGRPGIGPALSPPTWPTHGVRGGSRRAQTGETARADADRRVELLTGDHRLVLGAVGAVDVTAVPGNQAGSLIMSF